jgi:adenylate kinase
MEYLDIPGDYDALRAMDQEYVLNKWQETAEQLAKRPESFMLDTHIMNLTHGKVIRRDGPWIGDYDALMLVTADPTVILERVTQDVARDRALFPEGLSPAEKLAMVTDYQNQTKQLFGVLAARFGLPSAVIVNDTLDQAVTDCTAFIETISQSRS